MDSEGNKEVLTNTPGKKNLRIEPIDAFSFCIKFEGGGELPESLKGAYSHSRAVQMVEEYIRNK